MITREDLLEKLRARKEPWDLIVIGGGATGLGIALDASARGLDTVLLEKGDFASGTSSKSTKLIHGGIRYLQTGSLRHLIESAREQRILREIAPHLLSTVNFILPTKNYLQAAWYRLGLFIFDCLTFKNKLPSSKFIGKSGLKKLIPNIKVENLVGGIQYSDVQFNDSRFALSLALTSIKHGGVVLNYMPVTALTKSGNSIDGVIARDEESQNEFTIKAKVVINACGPQANYIRKLDDADSKEIIEAVQGIHLVLPLKFLGGDRALIIPATSKNRVLYLIPWEGKALLGTTEHTLEDPHSGPKPSREEIEYLISECKEYLENPPSQKDILSVFAGIRPLIKVDGTKPSEYLPRDFSLLTSPSGLISVLGGKWTTYRVMAESCMELVENQLSAIAKNSQTKDLKLDDYQKISQKNYNAYSSYGSKASNILEIEKQRPELSKHIHPHFKVRWSMLYWGIHHEFARSIEDLLSRRTSCLLEDAKVAIEIAPQVAEFMQKELMKDTEWKEYQLKEFMKISEDYLPRRESF